MVGRFGKLAYDEDDGLGNEAVPKDKMKTLSNQRDRAASAEKKEKEAPTAGRWGGRVSEKVLGGDDEPRKLRSDLTPEEKERMEKHGSLNYKSAGATQGRHGGRASEKAPGRDVILNDREYMERLNDIDRQEKRGRLTPQEAEMARKELKSKQEDLRLLPAQDEDEDIALKDKKRDYPGFATDPPVSEAQRKAMFAAKSGNSTLGIPQSVGKEFANADPGGHLPEHK